MSEQIFATLEIPSIRENDNEVSSYISVSRFCCPERIVSRGIDDSRKSIQISIDTPKSYGMIRLTKTQALSLAEKIQNVYRDRS